ncbi:hypothetical protein ACIBW9_17710 [Streptomyces sp. NPDC049541]|uniref:hypothetical protein n=1 Tax=Streptomyces sp. NPDC049541 TaxID=3365594 RepID=UPI00378FCD7F
MALSFENLVIPGSSGRRLIAYTAEPGSPSEAALHLLGSVSATRTTDATAAVRGRKGTGLPGEPDGRDQQQDRPSTGQPTTRIDLETAPT